MEANVKNKFRALVAEKGHTVSSAAELAGFDKRGIHNKLNRGSLRVTEFLKILDALDYEIHYKQKGRGAI